MIFKPQPLRVGVFYCKIFGLTNIGGFMNKLEICKHYAKVLHSDRDSNYCSMVAWALAFDCGVLDARKFFEKRIKRQRRRGVNLFQIEEAMGSLQHFYAKSFLPPTNSKMTVKSFCKEFPTGTWYVLVSGHALVIDNGKMIDYLPKGERRIVKRAWRIIRKEIGDGT